MNLSKSSHRETGKAYKVSKKWKKTVREKNKHKICRGNDVVNKDYEEA